MKKKHILIAVLSVVGSIVLIGFIEWALKQPIRRDFEYFAEYAVDVTDGCIYIYSSKAEVSGRFSKEATEPLWFDYEKGVVHLKEIIYCETSPWESLFGSGVADDTNWLTAPMNLEGRHKGEAPFPKSGRFFKGEYCDYVYDEVWYEDRDGTLHLVWSINDMNEENE